MRVIASVILISCFFLLKSQGFRTRYYPPGAVNSYAKFIMEISPGNYIAGGLIVDLDNNGNQIGKIGIVGLDQDGNVTWLKKYGGGNYQYLFNQFVRRSFYRKGNFIYHTCNVQNKTTHNYEGAFVKFDLNGDTIWQRIYSAPSGIVPQMLTESIDGGFLITGYYFSGNTCFLLKTDANGNELWRKQLGIMIQDGRAIIQDAATKKIVIAGYQLVNSFKSSDNIIITDSIGAIKNQVSFIPFGGVYSDLIQTQDKKIVGLGTRLHPETLGGNYLTSGYSVKFDLNSPMSAIWKAEGPGPISTMNTFNCLYELGNEDMMIGGDLDTIHMTNKPFSVVTRLIRIDKNGYLKWSKAYNYRPDTNYSSDSYEQVITSLIPGSNGVMLASFQLYNSGVNPFFFVKYDANGCDSTLAYCSNMVGIEKFGKEDYGIKVYPNPAKDKINIEWDDPGSGEIDIKDISGRELKRVILERSSILDISDLQSGIFFLNVSRKGKVVYTSKLVKTD